MRAKVTGNSQLSSRILFFWVLLQFLSISASSQESSIARKFQLRPCEIEGVQGEVECGEIPVPENHHAPGGRTIRLNVVILQALAPSSAPDPLLILQGGPGQAVTPLAPFYGRAFEEIRKSRDIVLVDVRGTDTSTGLYCDVRQPDHMKDIFAPERVRTCRAELAERADLSRYTTQAIVDDFAEVLKALEIARVNLYGTSYGTRVALEILRRYPTKVRTATLKAVLPPGFVATKDFSRDAYAVVSKVLTRREQAKLDHLLKSPPEGMSPGFFSEVVRNQLYDPALARQLSSFLHEDADFGPLLKAARQNPWVGAVSLGVFLSVSCTEDRHRVPPSLRPPTVRSLGDFREVQQAAACDAWAPMRISTTHRKPFVSDVPVLVLSGELDPVTPPRWGERAIRNVRNSIHVVLKDNGHAMGDKATCIAAMMKTLIDQASVATIRGQECSDSSIQTGQ